MKNVRVKVRAFTCGRFDFGIFEGREMLMLNDAEKIWERKTAAIRNAKAMAKRIGIPFDDEIVKQHGY